MIETANLSLVPCTLQLFEAILSGAGDLEKMVGARVFENWYEFPGVAGIEALQFGYEYLKSNPEALGWWSYLFVHTADNALIGIGGFKGAPNEVGMVEIGYAIIPAYRCRGYASEAAHGLTAFAFSDPRVKFVDAHTLAEPNASTRVLEKIGMKRAGTAQDPDVGEVWRWTLERKQDRKRLDIIVNRGA
jgi:[ribosomal protein S5]-alanine N-acetyltransferase